MGCLNEDDVLAYVEGDEHGIDRAVLESHIDACSDCAALVANAAAELYRDDDGTAEGTGQRHAAPEHPRPTIGRYELGTLLGRGAMGAVYEAHDRTLRRDVAIKVLGTGHSRHAGSTRMLREAQALARLNHPNVVAVHDVGRFDDGVFIAMERLRGQTFRQWLLDAPRHPDEILAVLRPAGRGLVAAHDAGLLHRDFKPDNVFVGDDGRVTVMDLGLAQGVGDTVTAEPRATDPGASVISGRLTLTGTVLGTPAYMAPEQWRGEPLDERADQFAFAVTLWEAVYGERPFSGATMTELRRAVQRGEAGEPPRDASVPSWLHRALVRALSVDRERRFASMSRFLAALQPRPRRLAGAMGLGLALVSVAAFGVASADPALVPCDGAQQWAAVWSPERASSVRTALAADSPTWGAASLDATDRALRAFGEQWTTARDDACLAVRGDGRSPGLAGDRTLACLQLQRVRAEAIVGRLEHGDATVLAPTHAAALALPSPTRCAAAPARTPQDDEPRARALRQRLQRVATVVLPSESAATLTTLDSMVAEAEALGAPALLADVLNARSRLLEDLSRYEDALADSRRAASTADAAGADEQAAVAWVSTAYLLGQPLGRVDEAAEAEGFAEASLVRANTPARLAAGFSLGRAARLYREGRLDDAHLALERARDQVERLPNAPLLSARLHSVLGAVEVGRGNLEQGLANHERAEAILIAERGKDHPARVFELANAANAEVRLGRWDEALARLRLARDVLQRSGSERADVEAELSNNIALVVAQQGDVETAMLERRHALDRLLAAHGPEHPSVPILRSNLALDLSRLDRHEEALAEHRRALEARELRVGEDHVSCAYSWQGIGEALTGLSRHDEAARAYDRARVLRSDSDTDPYEVAESESALARSLLTIDPSSERALELLRAAARRLAGNEQPDAVSLRTSVSALLAETHSAQL